MRLDDLTSEYDRLQRQYGAPGLDPIYSGGCEHNPDLCFVFMNPTGRNIASSKEWKGLKAPWIGTKTIWGLFYRLGLLDEDVHERIQRRSPGDWTEEFAAGVYANVEAHRYFITNLGKCTQSDARPLPDSVYREYLSLLEQELAIIRPKAVVLFGNQVSSVVLGRKISVSQYRKTPCEKTIGGETVRFFPVYYPVGNGRFHMDKSIEDIRWILDTQLC